MSTKIYRRLTTLTTYSTKVVGWAVNITVNDTDTAGSYCAYLRVTYTDDTVQTIRSADIVTLWKDDDGVNLEGEITYPESATAAIDNVTLSLVTTGSANVIISEVCA